MMKKSLKMISLLMVLAIMVLGIAGCGTSKDTAETEKSTGDISTPKLEGTFEIVQFSNGEGSDYHKYWLSVIDEFKKLHPDVKVETNIGPHVWDTINVRMASDNPPDYVFNNTSSCVNYAKDGKLVDLTEWYNTAKAIGYEGLLKDNLLSTESNVTLDGKIYGIPGSWGTWGVYYNKKMAVENGWKAPTNWQEFMELAPKIKEKGIYPIISTGVYSDYMFGGLIEPGILSQAGRQAYVDIQNKKPGAWNNPLVLEMYNRLKYLVDNDYLQKEALALNHTESQIEFLNGKAFMVPCGNWMEGEMTKDIPEGFEFGFIPGFMQDAGKKPVFVSDPSKYVIPVKAKNIEAAKEFLRVMLSKTAGAALVESGISLPYVKDDFAGLKMLPTTAGMMQQLSSGAVDMVSPKGEGWGLAPDVFKASNDMIQAIWGRKTTPEEAVKKIEAESAKALADSAIPKIKAE